MSASLTIIKLPCIYSVNRPGPPKKPKCEDQAWHPPDHVDGNQSLSNCDDKIYKWWCWWLCWSPGILFHTLICQMPHLHFCSIHWIWFQRLVNIKLSWSFWLYLTSEGCLQRCATKECFNSFPVTEKHGTCIKSTSTTTHLHFHGCINLKLCFICICICIFIWDLLCNMCMHICIYVFVSTMYVYCVFIYLFVFVCFCTQCIRLQYNAMPPNTETVNESSWCVVRPPTL